MLSSDTLNSIVKKIIDYQSAIVGPVALEQAKKVSGIRVTEKGDIIIDGEKMEAEHVLTQLVQKYSELFGRASIEACKEAVKESQVNISAKDLPSILQ